MSARQAMVLESAYGNNTRPGETRKRNWQVLSLSLLFLKIDHPESAMRLDLEDSTMLLLTDAAG